MQALFGRSLGSMRKGSGGWDLIRRHLWRGECWRLSLSVAGAGVNGERAKSFRKDRLEPDREAIVMSD